MKVFTISILDKNTTDLDINAFNERDKALDFSAAYVRKWINSCTHVHACAQWVNEINNFLSKEQILKAVDVFNYRQNRFVVEFNIVEVK